MAGKIKGFTVTLEGDVTEEDAIMIANAIIMFKGVINVTPSEVTVDDHINRMRIKTELTQKLIKVLD